MYKRWIKSVCGVGTNDADYVTRVDEALIRRYEKNSKTLRCYYLCEISF